MSDVPVTTINEFEVTQGTNLPNHTSALRGQAKFVRINQPAVMRTRQAVYRLVAHLLCIAELLPHEEGEHTLAEITDAIENL